jgi:hypothetical protein
MELARRVAAWLLGAGYYGYGVTTDARPLGGALYSAEAVSGSGEEWAGVADCWAGAGAVW